MLISHTTIYRLQNLSAQCIYELQVALHGSEIENNVHGIL